MVRPPEACLVQPTPAAVRGLTAPGAVDDGGGRKPFPGSYLTQPPALPSCVVHYRRQLSGVIAMTASVTKFDPTSRIKDGKDGLADTSASKSHVKITGDELADGMAVNVYSPAGSNTV